MSADPLLLGQAPAPVAANHPRSAGVAALLTLLCPGLGHFYSGAVAAGLAWSVAPHLALTVALLAGAFSPAHFHTAIFGGAAAWLTLRLVQVFFAARRAAPLKQYTLRRFNNPALYLSFFLGTSIFTSLLGYPMRAWVLEPYKVPSEGMEPALLPGDQFFALKVGPAPGREQVVVFRMNEVTYVKRVVGVDGDMIEASDGRVLLNGAPVPRYAGSAVATFGPVRVEAGQLFVLGDNVDSSLDSRHFGVVPLEKVIGRASAIWLSAHAGRIGVIP